MPQLPYRVRGMDLADQLWQQIGRNLGGLPQPDFRAETIQDENEANDPNWQGPREATVLQKAFPPSNRIDDKMFEPPSPDWAANTASKLPPRYQEAGGRALSLGSQALEFLSRPENAAALGAGALFRTPESPIYSGESNARQVGYGDTPAVQRIKATARAPRLQEVNPISSEELIPGRTSRAIAPKTNDSAGAVQFAAMHNLTIPEAHNLIQAGHKIEDFNPNTDEAFRAHQELQNLTPEERFDVYGDERTPAEKEAAAQQTVMHHLVRKRGVSADPNAADTASKILAQSKISSLDKNRGNAQIPDVQSPNEPQFSREFPLENNLFKGSEGKGLSKTSSFEDQWNQSIKEAKQLGIDYKAYDNLDELQWDITKKTAQETIRTGKNPLNKPPEESSLMRVPNPGGERDNIALGPQGVSTILDALGNSLYSKDPQKIIVKEGLQNSFDEHRIVGETGPINVAMNRSTKHPVTNEEAHSVTIKDLGRGLTPDELYTIFTNVGETGKSGIDSASGGFGFAKAAPTLGGDYYRAESIVNEKGQKVQYTFQGDPTELKNQKTGVPLDREVLPPDTKTGLKVTTWFPKDTSMYGIEDLVRHFTENSPSITSPVRYGQGYDVTQQHLSDFLDNVPHDPVRFGAYDYNHMREGAKTFTKKPAQPKQDTITLPGTRIDIHYEDKPTDTTNMYTLHYLNKGMYQESTNKSYAYNPIDNVPRNITANIHATVEEGQKGYPFSLNRQDVNEHVTKAINKWVEDNIVSGAQNKQRARLIGLYKALKGIPVQNTVRTPVFYDAGERLTPDERRQFENSPSVHALVQNFDSILDHITKILNTQYGTSTRGEKLEGIGLLLSEDAQSKTYGMHVPNPDQTIPEPRSTIAINSFARFAEKDPEDAALDIVITAMHEGAHISDEAAQSNFSSSDIENVDDPRLGKYIQAFLKQLENQGGLNAAHGFGFMKRLAEIFVKYGPKAAFAATDKIHAAITDSSGQYNREIQELLQIYKKSRGRPETTEDFLSTTGVKQGSSKGGEGDDAGNDKTNGIRAVEPIKGKSSSSELPEVNKLDKFSGYGSVRNTALEMIKKAGNNYTTAEMNATSNRQLHDFNSPLDKFWSSVGDEIRKSKLKPSQVDPLN